MAAPHVEQALSRLKMARAHHKTILIAYSGGRDSSSLLHLALKVFPARRVHCYHYFTIPHLIRFEEKKVYALPHKYGIPVHQFPTRDLLNAVSWGYYLMPPAIVPGVCDYRLIDHARTARGRTGIHLIASGAKRCDGVGGTTGRSVLLRHHIPGPVVYPLEHWSQQQVVDYMAANDIVLQSQDEESSCLDLRARPICHMFDCHRDDYERFVTMFPLAEAVIWHRKFYGAKGFGKHTAVYVKNPKPPPSRQRLPNSIDWRRLRRVLLSDALDHTHVIRPQQMARERAWNQANPDSPLNPRNVPD